LETSEAVKIWSVYFVGFAIFSIFVWSIQNLRYVALIYRIHLSSQFLSSIRYWSVLNYCVWTVTSFFVLIKNKTPKILAFLGSVLILMFMIPLGDFIWTYTTALKWAVISPNEQWLRIWTHPLLGGNPDYHSITLLSMLLVSFPALLFLNKWNAFNFKNFLRVYGAFIIFRLIYVLLAPNPAWTDWGFLTVVYPEYRTMVPMFLVFFILNVVGRGYQTLAILLGGVNVEGFRIRA